MSLILVADDESHIVQVLALKFRNAGHDVIEANDGEEALGLVRKHRPDVLVTDMQMPFMNGIELAGAMLDDPATASIPVVVLTARGWAMDECIATLANVKSVESKPFSPREILSLVENLVDSTKSRSECS
ncbi:MAG: response regulator [Phycisphaerae bacterium]|nr:response regulator [Phycisphaerae bacterium]HAW96854.1 response regulator [Phycisphaerales bacterium]